MARIRQHFKSHSETKLTWVAFPSLAVALAFTLSACGPATSSITLTGLSETGFQTPDGRAHTGADASDDLEILKNELVEQNKDLARRILSARIARVQTRIFVYMTLQDSLQKNERVSFEFDDSSDSKTATPAAGAKGTDTVRFKSVRGLFSDGSRSSYELSLLCERAEASSALANTACRTATVALKEFQKGTSTELARAGLILRNREVLVLSKALSPNLKNMLLKQVLTSLQTVRTASLESFEVAWGRSGFALHSDELKNLQLCPVGRLVETNESDDPLQLTCSGKNQPREIEGRMLGNTTHGELFLELISTSESLFSKEKERVYLMIRHKRAVDAKTRPQNDPKQTPSVPSGTTTTVQTPAQAPTTGAPEGADADEESDEYESLFLEDEQPATPDVPEKPDQTPHELTSKNGQTRSLVPAQPGDGKTGWLVPVDTKNPITRFWSRDRQNPVIDKKVQEWKSSSRLRAFAHRFPPNQNFVLPQLAKSRVPNEFAFITMIESVFFIEDGYPVEISSARAVGPWQFLPSTASDSRFGLKVRPLIAGKSGRRADPCDERADLAKSSEAAGKYFRVLLNMFPRDPKLAVMAYNWGEGSVSCLNSNTANCQRLNKRRGYSNERLEELRKLGFNYWSIRKFNMAPAESLNYVVNFVAAHNAALEMEPIKAEKEISPWRQTCAAK